jgi:hypothetical protein
MQLRSDKTERFNLHLACGTLLGDDRDLEINDAGPDDNALRAISWNVPSGKAFPWDTICHRQESWKQDDALFV